MPTLRWLPTGQIWNELDRADDGRGRSPRDFGTGGYAAGPPGGPAAYPPVNVWDDDESVYLDAELPGVALEDLEITITDGNRLTLKGQRKPPKAGQSTWHR